MSDWDKIAADAAIEYAKPTMRPVQTMSDHMADAFHEGARWQREALLSDETVERAARGCFDIRDDAYDDREWGELDSQERELYLCQARAALAAALGEDESNE